MVSAFRLIGLGTIPVAAVLGGLLGRVDLRLPYVIGAIVLAGALVAAAVQLRGDAIGRARAAVEPAEAGGRGSG